MLADSKWATPLYKKVIPSIRYFTTHFQQKVPAAVFVGNGFGKLAGTTQVEELGNLETPIILTNTLNVPTAMDAVIKYTLQQPENENVA